MLVVTNYPNVPIATTNAATDAARTDNLQRPPVIPPQEMTKGHDERPFNPKHERTAEQADVLARLNEKSQGKQQGTGQQQEDSKQQQQQSKSAQAHRINELLKHKPALQRRDIRTQFPNLASGNTDKHLHVQKNDMGVIRSDNRKDVQSEILGKEVEFYQLFGQHIEHFYHEQTEPKVQPAISTLI